MGVFFLDCTTIFPGLQSQSEGDEEAGVHCNKHLTAYLAITGQRDDHVAFKGNTHRISALDFMNRI